MISAFTSFRVDFTIISDKDKERMKGTSSLQNDKRDEKTKISSWLFSASFDALFLFRQSLGLWPNNCPVICTM